MLGSALREPGEKQLSLCSLTDLMVDLFSHTSVSSEISGVFVLFTAISLEEKECPVHNR